MWNRILIYINVKHSKNKSAQIYMWNKLLIVKDRHVCGTPSDLMKWNLPFHTHYCVQWFNTLIFIINRYLEIKIQPYKGVIGFIWTIQNGQFLPSWQTICVSWQGHLYHENDIFIMTMTYLLCYVKVNAGSGKFVHAKIT